jgi:hypothetical protein
MSFKKSSCIPWIKYLARSLYTQLMTFTVVGVGALIGDGAALGDGPAGA